MTMKTSHQLQMAIALILIAGPFAATAQTNLFNDTFTAGSTINATSPANPTTNSAAYEEISSKTWVPNPPTIASRDLKFGIGSTTSGSAELQALFATNAVALTQLGDYLQMVVTFTNTSGL